MARTDTRRRAPVRDEPSIARILVSFAGAALLGVVVAVVGNVFDWSDDSKILVGMLAVVLYVPIATPLVFLKQPRTR